MTWHRTEAGCYATTPDGDGRYYRVCRYERWWYCEAWRVYENGVRERKDVFDKFQTLRDAKTACTGATT